MRKILKIAQRDFIETVKTRTFLLSLILPPLMGLVVGGISFLNLRSIVPHHAPDFVKDSRPGRSTAADDAHSQPDRRVAVIDLSGQVAEELTKQVERHNKDNPERRLILKLEAAPQGGDPEAGLGQLKKEIFEGRLDACLVVAGNALEIDGKSRCYFRRLDPVEKLEYSLFSLTVHQLLTKAIVRQRFLKHNLSPDLIEELRSVAGFEKFEVAQQTEKKVSDDDITGRFSLHTQKMQQQLKHEATGMVIPVVFMILMFIGVIFTGQSLLTSVIEEKASRVIEVLLASVTPLELMTGKILGLTGAGLTMIATWGFPGLIVVFCLGLAGYINPAILACFFIYFILGSLIYSSIFVAIGSVCNTLKEAQNLIGPVMLTVMLPMFMWFLMVHNPSGPLAVTLSFIPPISSFIMILRLGSEHAPPVYQIVLSLAVLAISTLLFIRAAGRIFRIGVLMYGKPPTPRELLRWLRVR